MSISGSEVLHILRNPYSWTEEDQRQARLKAADLIEAQGREIAALRADVERMDWLLSKLNARIEDYYLHEYKEIVFAGARYRVPDGVTTVREWIDAAREAKL